MNIGVVGLGYVGTAVQMGFESTYISVYTYDIQQECTEPDIASLVHKSEIIFICVPTPMNIDGTCNTDIVESVLRDISNVETAHPPICVLKSTVPPGTTDILAKQFPQITICFNPEFLTEKNYVNDFMAQVTVIIGHTGNRAAITPLVELYYERFERAQVWTPIAKEAEMIKYVANTLLSTKVAYLNEIYQICQKVDIEYDNIIKILGQDPRLGTTHWTVPGHDGHFGFGGTCFPKDLNALIQYGEQNGQPTPLLKAVWEKNLAVRPERDWEHNKGRSVV